MKCVICGIGIESIEESIDQGWIPYFYESEIECGPACPECSGALIQMGKDGEMELKEQYERKIQYKENYLYEPSRRRMSYRYRHRKKHAKYLKLRLLLCP